MKGRFLSVQSEVSEHAVYMSGVFAVLIYKWHNIMFFKRGSKTWPVFDLFVEDALNLFKFLLTKNFNVL